MKPFIIYVTLLSFCIKCTAQMNKDSAMTEGYFAGTKVTIEMGMYAPIGNLSKILAPNPMFGVSIDIPTTTKPTHLVGLGFIIFSTQKSNLFLYNLNDSMIVTKIIKSGFIGVVHFTHRKYITQKYIFDQVLGLGIAIINTDIEKKNSDNENDKYYSINALNMKAGISIKRAVSKKVRIGLKLAYNFVPYTLFSKALPNDFGKSSLTSAFTISF